MFILPMKAAINSSRGEGKLGKVPQRFQPMSRKLFFFQMGKQEAMYYKQKNQRKRGQGWYEKRQIILEGQGGT